MILWRALFPFALTRRVCVKQFYGRHNWKGKASRSITFRRRKLLDIRRWLPWHVGFYTMKFSISFICVHGMVHAEYYNVARRREVLSESESNRAHNDWLRLAVCDWNKEAEQSICYGFQAIVYIMFRQSNGDVWNHMKCVAVRYSLSECLCRCGWKSLYSATKRARNENWINYDMNYLVFAISAREEKIARLFVKAK